MASLEVINLIQQNLEQDGILSQIRAQLLSSVVNILNGKEAQGTAKHNTVKNFLATDQGKICFEIFADMLSILKMSATLSVFLGECGVEYSEKVRSNVSQQIGVQLSDDQPIIMGILEKGVSGPANPKSSPTSKNEEKNKSQDKHSPGLKPITASKHRKGGHNFETDLLADSDLEASTSSVGSITSHGSGKGMKGLSPLAPLGGGLKPKELPAALSPPNFPNPHAGGLKHLNPLAPLGGNHNPLGPPQDKLSSLSTGGLSSLKSPPEMKKLSPTLGSLDKNRSLGNQLEHSFDDDKAPLSPYEPSGGNGKKDAKDSHADEYDISLQESFNESVQEESASFDESSKVSFEQSLEKQETVEPKSLFPAKNLAIPASSGMNKIEISGKRSYDDESDDESSPTIPSVNVIQSSAQVTRSTRGWNDSPEKKLGIETDLDTSHISVSEYPDSFEESVASESMNSDASPLRLNNPQKDKIQQPLKTIDDLLSDDDSSPEKPKQGKKFGSHDEESEDDMNEVRSSRADSIDTISRQRVPMREAFQTNKSNSNPEKLLPNKDVISPHESDEEDDFDQIHQSQDPSHSAILDESGEQHDHDYELSQSRRSNQEEEEEDYNQLTKGSAIKKSIFTNPTAASPNPNNRSKRSEEDDDDYGDEDFEEGENDDRSEQKKREHSDGEDDGSYIESLEEEIEEADDDERSHDMSFGGNSSADEDMFGGKKDKSANQQKLPLPSSRGSGNDLLNSRAGSMPRAAGPPSTTSNSKNYDHNSSSDDEIYMPSSRRSNEPEKKTIAKTDQNSDDEDHFPVSTGKNNFGAKGSLFGQSSQPHHHQKTGGRKYDENSHDEDEFEDVPETGSVASEFSAGGGPGSDGESFLHDQDEDSMERSDVDPKARGDSIEFSMSEQEISSSHGLDGYDYTTNALPPARRFGSR